GTTETTATTSTSQTTTISVKTTNGEPVSGSVSVATEYLSVISIQEYLANQKQIEIPLKIDTIQVYTSEDKTEIEVTQDNQKLTQELPTRQGLDIDETIPKEMVATEKLSVETLKFDAEYIENILKQNNIGEREISLGIEMSPKSLPPDGKIGISNDFSNEALLIIKNKVGVKLAEIPLDEVETGKIIKCEDVKENKVAKLEGSKFSCNPSSYCRQGFNSGQLDCGTGNSCCRPSCETTYPGYTCTDTTKFTCNGDIKRGYCSGGNDIVCCQKGGQKTNQIINPTNPSIYNIVVSLSEPKLYLFKDEEMVKEYNIVVGADCNPEKQKTCELKDRVKSCGEITSQTECNSGGSYRPCNWDNGKCVAKNYCVGTGDYEICQQLTNREAIQWGVPLGFDQDSKNPFGPKWNRLCERINSNSLIWTAYGIHGTSATGDYWLSRKDSTVIRGIQSFASIFNSEADPDYASHGCIRVANDDIVELSNLIEVGSDTREGTKVHVTSG
ncbi:MAG: L,D-transpeptidase, partial [Candidatus Pacearchaeota archaeon]